MGALYGILGETDAEELHAIGERLVHRGAHVSEWKANASLRLGFRSDHSGTERLAEGPVTFDGCVDNREVLAGSRRPAAASPVGDALLILDQFHQSGEEAFSRIAGLFAVAIARPDGRLLLARDRIGYAPVYYTVDRGRFIFASEYKSVPVDPHQSNAAQPRCDSDDQFDQVGYAGRHMPRGDLPGGARNMAGGRRAAHRQILEHPHSGQSRRRRATCGRSAPQLP